MSVPQAAPAPATVAGGRLKGARGTRPPARRAVRVAGAARLSPRVRSHAVRSTRTEGTMRSGPALRAIPRRVSGPGIISGAVAGALALAPAYVPAPARRAPARPQAPRRRVGADAFRLPAELAALLARLGALARGRMWIALISVLLVGIVGLQVVILQVNQQVGRSLEARSALQRGVSQLQVENSALSASARIESEAARLGMVPVGEGHTRFLSPLSGAAQAAAQLLARGVKAGSAAQSVTEAHTEAEAQPSTEAQAPATAEAQVPAQAPAESPASAASVGESQPAGQAPSTPGPQRAVEASTGAAAGGSEAAAPGQAPASGASEGGTAAGG